MGLRLSSALLSLRQTSAASRAVWKNPGSFSLAQSMDCASVQVQGLQPGSWTILGSPAVGAALGTPLQLCQASVGWADIQIFWIKFGWWIMQYTQTHTHKTYVVASATGGGHADLSNHTVSSASEFIGKIWSRACVLVSSPHSKVLMTSTLILWKQLCLSSQWSWDNS